MPRTVWKLEPADAPTGLTDGELQWPIRIFGEAPDRTWELHDQPLALTPGIAQLTSSKNLIVALVDGSFRIRIPVGTTLTLALRPIIPLQAVDSISGDGEAEEEWVAWPLVAVAGVAPGAEAAGLRLTLAFDAAVEFSLSDGTSLLQGLLEGISDKLASIPHQTLSCRTFDFPLIRELSKAGAAVDNTLGELQITFGTPELVRDDAGTITHLAFADTGLKADGLGEAALVLKKPRIRLDTLQVEADSFIADLKEQVVLFASNDAPLTLVLHPGCRFVFVPSLLGSQLTIEPPRGLPAMTVIVPGCEDSAAVLGAGREDRILFDVDGEEEAGRLRISAAGMNADARLRVRPLKLEGLRECRLTEGRLQLRDSTFAVQVSATTSLPYFEHSEGVLTLRAASGSALSASWQMRLGQTWADPTGNIEVREPRASVSVEYQREDGRWKINGKLGGELQFVGLSRLEGAARQWLGEAANALRLEFADLDLGRLHDPGSLGISLALLQPPASLRLWDVFDLDLTEFALRAGGIALGGGIRLRGIGGGVTLEGRLPRLALDFVDGAIRLSLANGDAPAISARLRTPGGISVAIELQRQSTAFSEELQGHGALSIPSMPAIAITCALGTRTQAGGNKVPLFLLYARTDYPVPLFPGVVLRHVGLGFGINKILQIIKGRSHTDLVSDIVNGPKGWPDPGQLSSWVTSDGDDTDLSLVADSYLAPAQQGEGVFPYVGAATIYARPTNDFVILLGANLWLMTSLEDARNPDYRKRPAAIGALALYPRHGYLEFQARTRPNSHMTEDNPFLRSGLDAVSAEIIIKASRDEFLFRVGPLRSEAELGGVRLAGQVTYATYVGSNGAIAVLQGNLSGKASLSAEVQMSFGPLRVSAGFRCQADLAFETVMAGMVLPELGLALYQQARVYVALELTVWAQIEFRLVIRFWRFRKTLSWSTSHSASLRLSVDLWLKVLVAREPELYGRAAVDVHLFGYRFSPTLQLGRETDRLKTAQTRLGSLLAGLRTPSQE